MRRTLTLLAASAACRFAYAQHLAVELRDTVTGTPIVGAIVGVVDAQGVLRREVLSDARGDAALRLPAAGTWRVRVRRVGIAPHLSAPVTIADGETRPLRLRLASVRFALPRVRVTARYDEACRGIGDERVAVLWDQVTTVLRSVALAREGGAVPLRVQRTEREVDREGTLLVDKFPAITFGTGRPFEAIHPDSLARHGYMLRERDGGWRFFAPDDSTLVSPAFAETHCIESAERDTIPGAAMLVVRPVRGRVTTEITGTAVVDTLTGALRRFDYRYLVPLGRLPAAAPEAGGSIAFARIASGEWIVSAWTIRMPLFESLDGGRSARLAGYREVGGTAEPFTIARRAAARRPDTVAVRVRVTDAEGAPLAGVGLLVDTASTGPVTDSAGLARLARPARTTLALRARRVGFGVRDTSVALGAADTSVTLVLARVQRLATAEVRATLADRVGFTERRRRGFGWFLDSAEVARRAQPNALGLLQGVPGLTLYRVPFDAVRGGGGMSAGRGGAMTDHPDWLPGATVPVMEMPTSLSGGGGRCIPAIWLDGQRANSPQLLALDARDVGAVELYVRGTQAPAQFQSLRDDLCGVVLVWTVFTP